jgi:fluoroacetyl-CoA thioesterase
MDLPVGLTARVELTVTDADTAQAVGSGDVPVLATPRALALAEAATVLATSTRLPTGMTTVGTSVRLEHRRPSPVGATVIAVARLAGVDGTRLRFDVSLFDGGEEVATGTVDRVALDRHAFVTKAFAVPPQSPAPAGSRTVRATAAVRGATGPAQTAPAHQQPEAGAT